MHRIKVIGGGLAGLTLGIALRRSGIGVETWEARTYPRHRVCGEFISGQGLNVIRELGLERILLEAGARRANTVAFFRGSRSLGLRRLPKPALCVSRHVLDALLAEQFCKAGGLLHTQCRIQEQTNQEGTVLATGRRPLPHDEKGWRWFGLKVHAHGVSLAADLEMHLDSNAYIGLCRVAEDVVNVCGLFRDRVGHPGSAGGPERLRGQAGTVLFDRLRDAVFEPGSFCAVAGLRLQPQPCNTGACRIGDCLTMIPPVTGNGMSMAFESAAIASGPVGRYAKCEISWDECTAHVANQANRHFGERLKWARRFQGLMFCAMPSAITMMIYRSGWRFAFRKTRA